jgi:hypothetical protein
MQKRLLVPREVPNWTSTVSLEESLRRRYHWIESQVAASLDKRTDPYIGAAAV